MIPNPQKEHPGYIIELFEGWAWLMRDGRVAVRWEDRGIWDTEEEAQAAMRQAREALAKFSNEAGRN